MRTFTPEELATMPLVEKLKIVHELQIDACILHLQEGTMHPRDMAAVNSLLKNNDIREEKPQESTMADKVLKELDN